MDTNLNLALGFFGKLKTLERFFERVRNHKLAHEINKSLHEMQLTLIASIDHKPHETNKGIATKLLTTLSKQLYCSTKLHLLITSLDARHLDTKMDSLQFQVAQQRAFLLGKMVNINT